MKLLSIRCVCRCRSGRLGRDDRGVMSVNAPQRLCVPFWKVFRTDVTIYTTLTCEALRSAHRGSDGIFPDLGVLGREGI